MKARKTTKLVHEGRYAAEVEIELLEEDHEWAPYLSMADAKKLDAMEKAGKLKRVPFKDRAEMKKLVDPVIAAYAKEIEADGILAKINETK